MTSSEGTRRRRRRILRWLGRGLAAAGAGMLAMMAFTFLWVADIQPRELRGGITEEAERRGRALLAQLERSHGGEAWRRHRSVEVDLTDRWIGLMGAFMNPFEIPTQSLHIQTQIGSWTSRMKLVDGPNAGDTWGIQDINVYYASEDGVAAFDPSHELSLVLPAGFLVATFQYFYEFVFRIGTAGIVAHAGEAERGGETYDRVFATWGQAEGHRGVDQYVLWINKRTGHVDRIEYTIRELASSLLGASEFSDFREVDGVVVPGRIAIKAVFPTGGETMLHEMSFGAPRFDTVEVGELRPDPTRAPGTK